MEVERTAWSRSRWVATIGLTFISQVVLFWLLSDPTPVLVQHPRPAPDLVLIAGTAADAQLHGSARFGEPTLFALADGRGFSGPVWWDFPRPRPQLAEWREPDSWLTLRLDRLATAFQQFAQSNTSPVVVITEKPPAVVAKVPVKLDLLPTESTVRVEGALAARELQGRIPVPVWPATEWLGDTVVQLAVNAAGQPVSAVLIERSGSKEADQRALELAWAARFAPLPGGRLPPPLALGPRTWGRLVFHWLVQPPPR